MYSEVQLYIRILILTASEGTDIWIWVFILGLTSLFLRIVPLLNSYFGPILRHYVIFLIGGDCEYLFLLEKIKCINAAEWSECSVILNFQIVHRSL